MAMASTSSFSSSSAFIDGTRAPRQLSPGSPQCVSHPALPPPPVQSQNRLSKTIAYSRKIGRYVMATATATEEAPVEVASTDVELPDIVKSAQETWEKVEDKYAVASLGVASVVALWASTGLLSAIDKLPLIPGVLELVGIGYTGWFAYKNLVFKPDREVLVEKIKGAYNDILGTS